MAFNPQELLRNLAQPPVLACGDTGWNVKLLRRLLAQQGIAVRHWLDAGQPVSPEFDAELQVLLSAFQLRSGLPATGIADAATWQALLEAPPASGLHPTGSRARLAARIVEIANAAAARQITEQAENRGATVEMLLRHACGQPGMPWCVAFAWAVIDLAYFLEQRIPPGIPASAKLSSSALVSWAGNTALPLNDGGGMGRTRLLADTHDARPGDLLVLRGGPTGYYHTALVVSEPNQGKVATVEGNTRLPVSAAPEGVISRQRSIDPSCSAVLRV